MITLFHQLRALLGTRPDDAAMIVHGVVLSAVALAWFWPPVAALFHRIPRSAPEIEWVRLWRCPDCSTFNRRAMAICTHCEFALPAGYLSKWIPLKWSEAIKRNARRLVALYAAIGWIFFYGLTGIAFFKLQLHRFHQNAIQELLASITMGLLLLALVFFYMALRPRFKSPLGAVMDGLAGFVVVGFMLFSMVAWNQARVFQSPSLAVLRTQSDGEVDLKPMHGRPLHTVAPVEGTTIKLDVQYVIFSWPVLGIHNATLTRVQGKPLLADALLWVYGAVGSSVRISPMLPQWLSFNQILAVPAGGTFAVYGAPTGGLVLRKS